MIIVKNDQGQEKFRIFFFHNVAGENAGTNCRINSGDRQNVGFGSAILSKSDRFDRRIGRKVALTKALRASNLTRDERKQIWDGYFSHVNDLRN